MRAIRGIYAYSQDDRFTTESREACVSLFSAIISLRSMNIEGTSRNSRQRDASRKGVHQSAVGRELRLWVGGIGKATYVEVESRRVE